MSEQQSTRIPDVDRSQMGHQVLQAVDEGFIAMNPETADRFVAPWVSRYQRYVSNQEMGLPQKILDDSKKLMTAEKLSTLPAEYLEQPGVAYSFDRLITNYAYDSGQLKELVNELEVKPMEEVPERKLLDLIHGENRKPSKPYMFSRVFLGLDGDITDDKFQKLIKLHADALKVAQEHLDSQLPRLKNDFYTKLDELIGTGVLPKNITFPGQDGDPDSNGEARLRQLEVIASDPVINRLSDRGGHYDAQENAVYIDADRVLGSGRSRTMEDTYTHEMVHAHSGHTVILNGKSMFEAVAEIDGGTDNYRAESGQSEDVTEVYRNDPDTFGPILGVTRVGLMKKVNIINEAYTEWATMLLKDRPYDQTTLWSDYERLIDDGTNLNVEITGQAHLYEEYGDVYLPNRIIMAGLVAHGIDPIVIGEAYFESYEPKLNNPNRGAGSTVPARRALDVAISKITPYKSLEQLQKRLWVQARKRWPKVRDYNDLAWGQALILSEILRTGTEEFASPG